MIDLLDVSVLIALLDADHVFHQQAHRWFEQSPRDGWATCPLTENGVVRIMGSPKYPTGFGSPFAMLAVARTLYDIPGHRFWPDDLSLLTSRLIVADELATSSQVTDTYLLALAVHNNGRLATFDRRLSPETVRGGREALHVID